MSVAVETAYNGPYVGDGANLNFPITFEWSVDSEVEVYLADEYLVTTLMAQGVDYNVNAGASRVEFVTAPLSTEIVLVRRATTQTQDQKFHAQGRWNPETIQLAIDKLTRLHQEARLLGTKASRLPFAFYNLTPLPAPALLYEVTASGVADYTIPISNRQSGKLRLELDEIASVGLGQVSIQFSYDGGSSWEGGTKYDQAFFIRSSNGATSALNAVDSGSIVIAMDSAISGVGINASIDIGFPRFTLGYPMRVEAVSFDSAVFHHLSGGAVFKDPVFQWVNAIRVLGDGNINNGTIRLIAMP